MEAVPASLYRPSAHLLLLHCHVLTLHSTSVFAHLAHSPNKTTPIFEGHTPSHSLHGLRRVDSTQVRPPRAQDLLASGTGWRMGPCLRTRENHFPGICWKETLPGRVAEKMEIKCGVSHLTTI